LRGLGCLCASFSLGGICCVSSCLSVLDAGCLVSTLSLRNICRVGSSLSVLGFLQVGSSMSLRSYARLGDSLSIGGKLRFPMANTHLEANTQDSSLDFYVNDVMSLKVTATGGKLSGTWDADNAVVVSDRRLKKDIKPLYRALLEASEDHRFLSSTTRKTTWSGDNEMLRSLPDGGRGALSVIGKSSGDSLGVDSSDEERIIAAAWVLRELRPISFKFKKGPEAKQSRFGFIAQELQVSLPSLVRESTQGLKQVVYNDLIAVLTLVAQGQEERLLAVEKQLFELARRVDALEVSGGLHSVGGV